MDSSGSAKGLEVGSCKRGTETSGSVKQKNFLTNEANISFSKRTLLHVAVVVLLLWKKGHMLSAFSLKNTTKSTKSQANSCTEEHENLLLSTEAHAIMLSYITSYYFPPNPQ